MTTDEIIKEAAGKFCGWKIPKDFYPDCYISIDRDKAFAHPYHGPTGTNLFTFDQAKEMFEHCIGERIAELEKSNAVLLGALKHVVAIYDKNVTGYLVGDAFDKARAAIQAAEVKP